MEIRVDLRLATLAAGVTASTTPYPSEHALVASTREALSSYASEPSIRWLSKALEGIWMLNLAMRSVQLGSPPAFLSRPQTTIPHFVQTGFSEPTSEELSYHLSSLWHETPVAALLTSQIPLWNKVVDDIAEVLRGIDVMTFQQRFFGPISYHPILVPLANLAPFGGNGIGVANTQETYAICCLTSEHLYHADPMATLELAQHESSHPVLADIIERYPSVPAACAFMEDRFPPPSRIVEWYADYDFRWPEVLIRVSTAFFFREIGRDDYAEAFLQAERKEIPIDAYIAALTPWWRERQAGRAPGLNEVFDQLPSWLQS
jgi:hypothetical protein